MSPAAPRKAIVTPLGDRGFQIEREFDAPRDLVFAVYTDPELIPQWWGSRTDTTIVEVMDVRPGGAFRFVLRRPDGGEIAFRGVYREVSPPERIVQTFEWEGAPGSVSIETTIFEEVGRRTRITTTSLFETTDERDRWFTPGMEEAMNELYSRLDELLAPRDQSVRPLPHGS